MSRIATLTAVLTMIVAPMAVAGPVDLRSPDAHDAAGRLAVTKVDLRSPDAVDVFRSPIGRIDLRSPDASVGFTPSAPATHAAPANDGSLPWWAFLGIIAAAFGACGVLAMMLRRHFDVGRPLGV